RPHLPPCAGSLSVDRRKPIGHAAARVLQGAAIGPSSRRPFANRSAGPSTTAIAFSSEVEPVRVKKTRQNKESRSPFRFNRNGKGSSQATRLSRWLFKNLLGCLSWIKPAAPTWNHDEPRRTAPDPVPGGTPAGGAPRRAD